jgi:group I intron endonuclease
MIGIYKITSPSGKIYIGQSTNIEKRWKWHKYSPSTIGKKLHSSYLKYGHDKHLYEIIEECNIELLNERERYWILYYDSIKKGLNSTLSNKKTYLHDEEVKKRIRESNKGKPGYFKGKKRPGHAEFMKNATFNKLPKTDSQKKKMSESKKGTVVCRDLKTGELKSVPKDEYDANHNLVGVTGGVSVQKTRKKIVCEELKEEFNGAVEAKHKYGFSTPTICRSLKNGERVYKDRYPGTNGILFKYV